MSSVDENILLRWKGREGEGMGRGGDRKENSIPLHSQSYSSHPHLSLQANA